MIWLANAKLHIDDDKWVKIETGCLLRETESSNILSKFGMQINLDLLK